MERYHSSTVLINMGCEILLTEVCVRLFLSKKFTVFVTVANEDEAAYIGKKFPQVINCITTWSQNDDEYSRNGPTIKIFLLLRFQLGKNRIFNADRCEYELQSLRETKGKGVNFVINCLPGVEHITASLNAVSKTGNYIETVKTNCNIGNSVGEFLDSSFACD